MSLYVQLLHGRNTPEEDMDDWGFDGPCLGPLEYVHVTYNSTFNLGCSYDNFEVRIVEGCFFYDGKYYGDWEIQANPKTDLSKCEHPSHYKLDPESPQYVVQRAERRLIAH